MRKRIRAAAVDQARVTNASLLSMQNRRTRRSCSLPRPWATTPARWSASAARTTAAGFALGKPWKKLRR